MAIEPGKGTAPSWTPGAQAAIIYTVGGHWGQLTAKFLDELGQSEVGGGFPEPDFEEWGEITASQEV